MNTRHFFNPKPAVKHLPALAAVVAITLALAFTPRTVDSGFAQDPNNPGQWIDLSSKTIGEDYDCIESEENCVYADTTTSSQVLREGTYIEL